MARTEQPLVFVAPSGKTFVYLTDMPFSDEQVCYRPDPDSKAFYALATGGNFCGNTTEHIVRLSDPRHDVNVELHKKGKAITDGIEWYVLDEDAKFDPSQVIPLPGDEYLCQIPNNTLVYVDVDKFIYSRESLHLFVSNGKTMRQIPVDNVTPDGDTIYVETPEQPFFFPWPFNDERDSDVVPQWGTTKLVTLNLNDYDITKSVDTDGCRVVTITKK